MTKIDRSAYARRKMTFAQMRQSLPKVISGNAWRIQLARTTPVNLGEILAVFREKVLALPSQAQSPFIVALFDRAKKFYEREGKLDAYLAITCALLKENIFPIEKAMLFSQALQLAESLSQPNERLETRDIDSAAKIWAGLIASTQNGDQERVISSAFDRADQLSNPDTIKVWVAVLEMAPNPHARTTKEIIRSALRMAERDCDAFVCFLSALYSSTASDEKKQIFIFHAREFAFRHPVIFAEATKTIDSDASSHHAVLYALGLYVSRQYLECIVYIEGSKFMRLPLLQLFLAEAESIKDNCERAVTLCSSNITALRKNPTPQNQHLTLRFLRCRADAHYSIYISNRRVKNHAAAALQDLNDYETLAGRLRNKLPTDVLVLKAWLFNALSRQAEAREIIGAVLAKNPGHRSALALLARLNRA